ncbi:MAG TPA: hypothetical protein VNM43_11115 [Dehalococcoidia bacterium]|nr:hypothetical protein [Dehalococcoidia bacterium]
MEERGATLDEVVETVRSGEPFQAKYGRTGFRKAFAVEGTWGGKEYTGKVVDVYAVREGEDWLVITAIVKYVE